jgi:hypothetical protein
MPMSSSAVMNRPGRSAHPYRYSNDEVVTSMQWQGNARRLVLALSNS